MPQDLENNELSLPTNLIPEQTPTELPTNPPAPTELPAELLLSYNNLLSERAVENQQLRARLNALENRAPAEPVLTPEESSKAFFEDPVALIRREIAKAVAPINEAAQASKRESEYAKLKSQMRADPRFSDLNEIEPEFDALMNGQTLDPNLMIAAYYAAYGKAAKAGKFNSAPPATPPTPTIVNPPHLRPTTPTAPSGTPAKTFRALTENEETVRRYNKMTVEEYLRGMGEIQ